MKERIFVWARNLGEILKHISLAQFLTVVLLQWSLLFFLSARILTLSSVILNFCTFPEAVLGKSSVRITWEGIL